MGSDACLERRAKKWALRQAQDEAGFSPPTAKAVRS